MTSLVSASQVVTGQVQSLDSVRAHALPSDAMIFASGTKVQPANQNPGSYAIVESAGATTTIGGSVPAVTLSPFADVYKEGSMYFPGVNTSNISVTLGSSYAFSGGLTAEAWVYYTTFTGASLNTGWTPTAGQSPCALGAFTPSNPAAGAWQFGADINGKIGFYYYASGNGTGQAANTITSISLNTWNHIAVSIPSGGPISIYVNGVQQTLLPNNNGTTGATSSTVAIVSTVSAYNYLGVGSFTTAFTTGYIADARVVYGAALYTGSSFTVPSAPLSPSATGSNALLLRAGANAPTIQSGALTFDRGLKQYQNYGPMTFNIVTQGFTAVWRGAFTGTAKANDRLFEFGTDFTNGYMMCYRPTAGGPLSFIVTPSTGTTSQTVNSSAAIVQGTTYVYMFRYDPVSQILDVWANGIQVGSTSVTTATLVADRILSPVVVGGYNAIGTTSMTSNTLAIYNRALSNVEIYNSFLALTTSSTNNAPIEIGDVNGTPALSIAGDGRVNVTKLGQTSNVLPWPPAAMTGYVTSINGQTYVASDSSEFNATLFGAWQAFDKNPSNQWSSGQPLYSTSAPYAYTGTVTTADVNGTVYPGEWLQIQLPSSVTLSSYSIYGSNGSNQMPGKWVVLGSRDGVNWFLVDSQKTAIIYTAASGFSSFSVNSTQAYSYYRVVTNQISGNSTYQCATILDLVLYGTADTAQTLTVAQPVTLSYGAQTASLTGISGDKYVPQDFSSSGLNIPAYVVSNTATVANTVAYSSFGPFAGEGSVYFPGGGTVPRISFGVQPQFAYNWTSYDFTMECFLYNTSRPYDQRLLSRDGDVLMYVTTGTNLLTFYSAGITSPTSGLFTGGAVPLNQWNHIAVSYIASSTTFYICVNGSVTTVPKVTGTFQYTGTNNTNIDYWSGQSGSNFGYLSNFRFTRGAALYTTNFTPPTGPLQPIQGVTQAGLPYGTVLLLRNAPAPGRVLTSKFGGANSSSVLSFPPSAMTGYSTLLNSGYGQGTYAASASTEYTPGAYYAWYAFDKSSATQWGGSYSYTTNVPYGGTVRTVDVNGTSYAGEWLQIQKPSSIVLSSYSILPQSGPSNTLSAWYVLGSRDGTNWFLIDQRSGATWTSGAYNTYQVQASQAFSYFRIVINIVSNGTGIGLPEWTLNGTIEGPNVTADGRLGVGVSNPVQALEVAGSAVVAGTLSAGNPLMFRNALYNGDMRIAQRGTSFASTTGYGLDRWKTSSYGAGGAYFTLSQIQSGLANFSNALQLQQTSTSSMFFFLQQSLETRDVVRFQGQPVTVSFWYKIPTSFSGSILSQLNWSTAVDAALTDPGVSYTTAAQLTLTNTTAWTYASFTTFVPSTATALSVMFTNYPPGGSTVNGAQIQITGVQLEKGTLATPFEVRPYAVELQLCQRYWEQSYEYGTAPGTNSAGGALFVYGSSDAGSNFQFTQRYIVPKRVAVSPTFYRVSTGVTGSWDYARSGASGALSITTYSSTVYSWTGTMAVGAAFASVNAYGNWVANAEL